MAMKMATFNGCKVYNLTTGKTMPQWLSENKKRALAKDEEYRRRLELIQDFEMATASQAIKMTPDGEHIIVAGTYPPVVRCYTTSDLAMKFQRGLTCEVVTFETLSDDFSKLVFLQADRTLNFHAPYGTHYSLRVPKFGRDLAYHWESCDLSIAASGDELYRLNLETGQFKEPFNLCFQGCNKVHINPVHQLLGCGGETGICEFWDSRSRKAVSRLRVDPSPNVEVTALNFDTDGLTLGVGTSTGKCIIYDIRSSTPLYIKEHQYELPVIDVTFHNSSKHIISTDKKVVKIWERHEPNPGSILTNIEAPVDINDVHVVSDKRGQSGMLFLAGEQTRVMAYFIPQLGPAPRWCSFLEGLTEELEETAGQSVYEDFKFITRQELEDLGAIGLIGTPMLKGYMHGFFIEMKLYNKLRAVSKPFEYEEHRKRRLQEKIDAKRQSRIIAQKRLPKINRDLAEKMMKKGSKEAEVSEEIIDNRFKALFEREEFQRDENAEEFKLRNPSHGNNAKMKSRGDDSEDEMEDLYQQVDDGSDDENGEEDEDLDEGNVFDDEDDYYRENSNGDDEYDESDEEDEGDVSVARKKRKSRHLHGREKGDQNEDEEGPIARASRRAKEKAQQKEYQKTRKMSLHNKKKTGQHNKPRLYELAEGVASSKAVFGHTEESRQQRRAQKMIGEVPLMERIEMDGGHALTDKREKSSKIKSIRSAEGVIREISFIPKSGKVKASERLDSRK